MSPRTLILLAALTVASPCALAGTVIDIDQMRAEAQRRRDAQATQNPANPKPETGATATERLRKLMEAQEAQEAHAAEKRALVEQKKREPMRQMEEEELMQRMADEAAASELRQTKLAPAQPKEAEARAAASQRQAELARVVGVHRDMISAKVRGNTRLPDTVKGNPEVRCLVTLLPTGEVQKVRVTQSSGNAAYDEAVLRATEKSSPLPLPSNSDARAFFVPEFSFSQRPKEESCCANSEKPKRAFVGANVREQTFVGYVDDWLAKVEQIGSVNYPEAARRQGIYGSLKMTTSIHSDGRIEAIEIDRSSGFKILDSAAIRIVELAAPYAPFPDDMRKKADILSITRTWTFTRSEQFVAE